MEELLAVRDRVVGVFGALLACLICGTAGYVIVEGWSVFDSLYMTVITLATVGYGETNPLSAPGRIFTIFLILGGIGVMTYAFTSLTAIVVEGQLSTLFKRRRMLKEIKKLEGHYIVCGVGHAGSVICSELKRTSRTFIVIDKSAEQLGKLAGRLGDGDYFILEGDATTDETLREAGVERAKGVFAVLATDQDNAFVALSAKGLNPKLQVVSAQKEIGVRDKLFRSGADNVVNPEYIGGLRMVSEMVRPATVGFLDSMIRDKDSTARFEEVDIPAGSSYVGQPVESVKGIGGGAPLLIAVQTSASQKYELNPAPSRPLAAGDKLVFVGEIAMLAALRRKVAGN